MARQSLDSIGPGASITRRGPRWTVRFVLPEDVCTRCALPREPRLISERLKDELTRQQHEREAIEDIRAAAIERCGVPAEVVLTWGPIGMQDALAAAERLNDRAGKRRDPAEGTA